MDRLRLNRLLARYTSLPRHQIHRSLTEFSKTVGQSGLILDLGSGTEKPYQQLFRSEQYFGIDLFEPADIQGDISLLPISGGACDAVICTEVLEHVPDPDRALVEIRRILKSGGYLVLTVPLLWGEHDRLDFQRWTEAGLRRLLLLHGFEILDFNKRGGLFSSIGCMVAQIPLQVFGGFEKTKNVFSRLLFLLGVILLVPIPWLLALLDRLDRSKNFVLGYSVLCRKRIH
jgi:SAM-dependent methyltransferase